MENKKVLVFILLAVFVIGVFSVVSRMRDKSVSKNPATQNLKMKTYTDAANKFSITIPEDWQANANIGTQKYDIGTPRETVRRVEVVQLMSRENVGVNIQMNEGKASCDIVPPANTTIAGLPATYVAKDYSLKLFTNDATYAISYFYPSVGKFHGPMSVVTPTPVTQAELDANKAMIDEIIKSFLPKDLTPLKC